MYHRQSTCVIHHSLSRAALSRSRILLSARKCLKKAENYLEPTSIMTEGQKNYFWQIPSCVYLSDSALAFSGVTHMSAMMFSTFFCASSFAFPSPSIDHETLLGC
jgi:hypothetical protein